jgi:hypothetical protein
MHSAILLFQEQQNGIRGEMSFPVYSRQLKQTAHSYPHPIKRGKCERLGKEDDEPNEKRTGRIK